MKSTAKKPATKTSDAAAVTETKPTPKPKKAPAVDGIGNRVGSQAARINAAMTKEPQTVEAIAEKAKLGLPRVRSHMVYLVNRKAAVSSKDGYALK